VYPRLMPGTTLLIDRHYNSLKPYRKSEFNMYAVLKNDTCAVRYVEVAGSHLILRPHNQSSPIEVIVMGKWQGRGVPCRPCLLRGTRSLAASRSERDLLLRRSHFLRVVRVDNRLAIEQLRRPPSQPRGDDENLGNARQSRPQRVCHAEQKSAHCCRLLLRFQPDQKASDAILAFEIEQVNE
jgi:hypothetical protein